MERGTDFYLNAGKKEIERKLFRGALSSLLLGGYTTLYSYSKRNVFRLSAM